MRQFAPAMLRAFGLALALTAMAGCGNGIGSSDGKAAIGAAQTLLGRAGAPLGQPQLAPDQATLRAALQQAGQPVYIVSVPTMNYIGFMGVYGQNGPVQTWASSKYETVSLRDGMLVATRGFGNDLMSSSAPDTAEARQGKGFFHRIYYYLDGADQRKTLSFDCNFVSNGRETIEILGNAYATNRVTESCYNPVSRFENTYWFDGSGKLRQSDQRVSPAVPIMRLQRVID